MAGRQTEDQTQIAIVNAARVRQLLHYDPDTGVLSWRERRCGVVVGARAGTIERKGYVAIWVDGRSYKAHRLAWLHMTGAWPTQQIDHINGERSDNRWSNLREATASQQMANTKTRKDNRAGIKGVCARRGCWVARVQCDGRRVEKWFRSPEEATAWRQQVFVERHGDFARHA